MERGVWWIISVIVALIVVAVAFVMWGQKESKQLDLQIMERKAELKMKEQKAEERANAFEDLTEKERDELREKQRQDHEIQQERKRQAAAAQEEERRARFDKAQQDKAKQTHDQYLNRTWDAFLAYEKQRAPERELRGFEPKEFRVLRREGQLRDQIEKKQALIDLLKRGGYTDKVEASMAEMADLEAELAEVSDIIASWSTEQLMRIATPTVSRPATRSQTPSYRTPF